MSETASSDPGRRTPTDWRGEAMKKRLKRRYANERLFRYLGLAAIALSALFLAFLLFTMLANGLRGFTQTEIKLEVDFSRAPIFVDPAALGQGEDERLLAGTDFESIASQAATATYGEGGPQLISEGAWISLREAIRDDPALLGRSAEIWVPASVELALAGRGERATGFEDIRAELSGAGALRSSFNRGFLTGSDATDPTAVGIWGALKGSLLTMIVTLTIAFPIGVLSAVYLEEYAPRNRWTDLIEVSINNLAAVPSIIFGLLGLAVFLNLMHLPRSAPLVGGLTLALMTMPVIVIAGRNAIKAVPPSIRDAALGIGASSVQVVFHHVLPLALPGILTGTIIGMARALGETAPLLMIGMRAFVATPPGGFTDPATVLPVQIFLWSDEVSQGFIEMTSAAIIVLLVFLLTMNGLAIFLRNKFERRW
ncbi:MAG: phosphate ABC transporter permease PstA [Sphingomonadaceae bacterium]